MSAPAGERPPLRIGNAEREAAYRALDAHLDAGRLDAEEYGDRYAKATVARNRTELADLFVDLPAPHPFPSAAAPSWDVAAPPNPSRTRSRGLFVPRLFPVLPLIALILFLSSGWWFAFLLIPVFAGVFGRRGFYGYGRRRHYGCW